MSNQNELSDEERTQVELNKNVLLDFCGIYSMNFFF